MEAQPPIPTEALLEHSDWVRRLARSLVFDPDRAEDVVQETWKAALETPPRSKADLKTWLAVVARNAARSLGRSEQRRRVREAISARAEALPDTVDVLERARLQKRVTDAVLELDEPYRTTLLLRHFEELKPAQIAERLGRPVNTVRTHLERGHAKLRAQLDDEYGGREAWGLALLPLARLPEGSLTSTALALKSGGIVMLLKWSLAASIAAIGWIALSQLGSETPAIEQKGVAFEESPAVAPKPSAPVGPAVQTEQSAQREELASVTSASGTAPQIAIMTGTPTAVSGHVVDAGGADLSGVRMRFVDRNSPRVLNDWLYDGSTSVQLTEELRDSMRENPELVDRVFQGSSRKEAIRALLAGEGPPSKTFTTGSDGRFSGELPFASWDVHTADEDLEVIGTGRYTAEDGGPETLYVVVPMAPVAGRVLDSTGAPAANVKIQADMTINGIHGFPYVLDESDSFERWSLEPTAADGRFRAEQLPVVPGLILRATTKERGRAHVLVDSLSRESVEMKLRVWSKHDPYVATGRVLDLAGAPVSGVRVMFSQEEKGTDSEGRFELEIGYLIRNARLIAAKTGFVPATLDGLEPLLREDRLAGQELVLRLGEPTRSIRGRVVDEKGKPCSAVRVYITGGDPFESVFANIEDILGDRGQAGVQTDAQGHFEYDGLYKQSYGLIAYQAGSFLTCSASGVAPGTHDVELVLSSSDVLERLQGRVVDRDGAPVAGAQLKLSFTSYSDNRGAKSAVHQDLGAADTNGLFDFEAVPYRELELRVGGQGVKDANFELDPERSEGLELVVELRERFRLDRERFDEFDSFVALDAKGGIVTLTEYRSGVTTFRDRVRLSSDSTWPNYEVSDRAVQLVFYRDDVEALRLTLELDRSEVTIVR